MTHPIELLVALEDGTLTSHERATLDEHLAGCSRCAGEVAAAAAGRAALRALVIEAPPTGILDAVATEAQLLARQTEPAVRPLQAVRAHRAQRLASLIAAAAAVVVIVSLALPHLGGEKSTPGLDAQGTEAAQFPSTAARIVESLDENYDAATVRDLAASYGLGATDATSGSYTAVSAPGTEGPAAPVASKVGADQAVACLRTAFHEVPGEPVRLIRARYVGTPAYLGVFLIGPGAGQPADEARVLIAASADCSALGLASADLRR